MTERRQGGESGSVVTVALLLGTLFGLGGMGSTAMAVVLPHAAESLGMPVTQATWFISLYALTMAVSTPIHGRLVDLFGVRLPMALGVLMMASGAVGAALAQNFPTMVVARLVQGLGTGVGFTLSVAVITAQFAGAERMRGLAISAGTAAAVGATGPLIGGLTEAALGWRATAALPVVSVVIMLLLWPRVRGRGAGGGFDALGAALVSMAAAGAIVLFQSASTQPGLALAGAFVVAVAGPLVVLRSHRSPDAFLPTSVLLNPRVVRACTLAGTLPAAWFSLLVVVPATLQAEGYAAVEVGAILLPSSLAAVLVPRLLARFVRGRGRMTLLMGSAMLTVVGVLVSTAGVHHGATLLMVLGVSLVTGSFGIGQPAMFSLVSDEVDVDDQGIATGFGILVFLACGAAGTAVLGGVSPLIGFDGGLVVLALLMVAVAMTALPDLRKELARAR